MTGTTAQYQNIEKAFLIDDMSTFVRCSRKRVHTWSHTFEAPASILRTIFPTTAFFVKKATPNTTTRTTVVQTLGYTVRSKSHICDAISQCVLSSNARNEFK